MINQEPFEITALVGDSGPELLTFSPGAQVFPNNDELWEIAQAVAEEDSTSYNDGGPSWDCPFCNGYQTDASHLHGEPFPHQEDCIVTKARALVEQRSVQPKVTVKVMLDNKQITGEK